MGGRMRQVAVAQQFLYRMYSEWMMNWLFLDLFGVKLRYVPNSNNNNASKF